MVWAPRHYSHGAFSCQKMQKDAKSLKYHNFKKKSSKTVKNLTLNVIPPLLKALAKCVKTIDF